MQNIKIFAFLLFVLLMTSLVSMIPLFSGVTVYPENYREHKELKEFRESGATVTDAQFQKWKEEERQLNKDVKAPEGFRALLKACQLASVTYNWIAVFILFVFFRQKLKTLIIFTIIVLLLYVINWLILPMFFTLIGAALIAFLIQMKVAKHRD